LEAIVRAKLAERALLALVAGLLAGLAGLLAGPAAALQTSQIDRELARARETESEAVSAVARAESQLAAVSARFDQLMVSAARAAEDHNGAQYALEEARATESEAAAEAARDEAAAEHSRAELGRVAASAYRTGGQLELVAAVLDADRADQFVGGAVVLQTVIRSHNTIADRAMEASAQAEDAAERARQARLDREEAARTAELAAGQAAAAVAEFETQVAALERERERALAELAAARGTTIALEEERQASLALAAAADEERAATASGSGQDGDPTEAPGAPADRGGETPGDPATAPEPPPAGTPAEPPAASPAPAVTREPSPAATRDPSPAASSPRATASPTASNSQTSPPATSSPTKPPAKSPPPPPSGAQLAIDYARAQLGKPYEWGAAGPDSFDCSGLTMRAWQRAGVSLPHWSVAQARMVTRVSYGQLRPGDLIFWSDNGQASGTYHVGLYVGAGKMIHAPRPGKVVEIQNVFYWRTPSFYGRV
jgi:cell wall-associated NlpC family hydrolase